MYFHKCTDLIKTKNNNSWRFSNDQVTLKKYKKSILNTNHLAVTKTIAPEIPRSVNHNEWSSKNNFPKIRQQKRWKVGEYGEERKKVVWHASHLRMHIRHNVVVRVPTGNTDQLRSEVTAAYEREENKTCRESERAQMQSKSAPEYKTVKRFGPADFDFHERIPCSTISLATFRVTLLSENNRLIIDTDSHFLFHSTLTPQKKRKKKIKKKNKFFSNLFFSNELQNCRTFCLGDCLENLRHGFALSGSFSHRGTVFFFQEETKRVKKSDCERSSKWKEKKGTNKVRSIPVGIRQRFAISAI